ncbi:MAG: trigger factor [Oscillospiraceae bacterium]|nr:trigger factor [Oscillospiraceae bacterium]
MNITSTQKKEINIVEMEIAVDAQELREAVDKVYKRKVKTLNVPGFRKGKAPRSMIERLYGEGIFLEDAVNDLYPKAYDQAIEESGIEAVALTDVEILSVEKAEGFTFKATITVKPEIELGKYKGIAVSKTKYVVEESEVEAEVERMRERAARIIAAERPAQSGDTVTIDFEGFVDDVAFAGGKAEGHKLELGSNSFIPGFEDQIIGHSTGDEFDVNVIFPAEYHAEELKAKPAVFKVKLHEISEKQLPEIDDELAKDVSEFDTLDELRSDIRTKLTEMKDRRATDEMETKIADIITEGVRGEIPEVMYQNKAGELAQEFSYRLQSQGMNLETYLGYTGMDQDAFREGFKEQAERHVKMRLALETIAVKESLVASDEDLETEYQKMAERYGVDVAQAKAAMHEKDVRADIACNKAIDFIREHAAITEVEEDKTPAAEKAPKAKAKATATKKPAAAKKTAEAKDTEEEKKAAPRKTAAKPKTTKAKEKKEDNDK